MVTHPLTQTLSHTNHTTPTHRRWKIWLAGLGCCLALTTTRAADDTGWFAFNPGADSFTADCPIDLRGLNEKVAGEHGFISIKNGEFVFGANGTPVRFWAVNGPPAKLTGDELKQCAQLLAKHGVNMVRVHGGYFDKQGEVDKAKVLHAIEIVEAMKAAGIYTHFSIYFPVWMSPAPGTSYLPGYNGQQHPFATLYFNPDFQTKYREWWTALLTTPSPTTGKTLMAEPAVASLEMVNEDSFFFWTFGTKNIPAPELQLLEKQFGDWLVKKYGSIAAAAAKWNGVTTPRDAFAEGRVGFRELYSMFNEKKQRDQDTAAFLLDTQTKFYTDTYKFLRKLGFKGPITTSNWITASPEVFGPLEKLSYAIAGDFIDRHGYFGCDHKGNEAGWSIRNGHTYADRSAYRFDAEEPGKPRQFVHPAMDPHYDGMPSMISETTWERPNRYRSEAPLYYAAYGALQHSDAIVHFAVDSDHWSVKPGYFMQPWTLMSPAMMGQFPAAALLYRLGLVSTGPVVANIQLNKTELRQLHGTPLPQDASLDELRLADVPQGTTVKPGQRLDPLLHYTGRVDVKFTDQPGSVTVQDLQKCIDHTAQIVTSATGELRLNYNTGCLLINAPRAQGVSGRLQAAGPMETKDLAFTSDLDLGHIIAVALDNQPLAKSNKILLQVMSEEKGSNFATTSTGAHSFRITNTGTEPWLVKNLSGTVRFKRADAGQLHVTALDFNGYKQNVLGTATEIHLQPTTVYYLIAR